VYGEKKMDNDILTAIGGPALLRLPDACRFIGVGRSKFYELVGRGEIEVVKVGTRTLVPMTSLEQFIRRLPSMRTTGGLVRGR
jgi:excisionase family DNA binding protein